MVVSWLLFLDSMQRKQDCWPEVSIKTDKRAFIGHVLHQVSSHFGSPLDSFQFVSFHLGDLSLSKTGTSTPAMFSQGLGRGELSLP